MKKSLVIALAAVAMMMGQSAEAGCATKCSNRCGGGLFSLFRLPKLSLPKISLKSSCKTVKPACSGGEAGSDGAVEDVPAAPKSPDNEDAPAPELSESAAEATTAEAPAAPNAPAAPEAKKVPYEETSN